MDYFKGFLIKKSPVNDFPFFLLSQIRSRILFFAFKTIKPGAAS